jgi:hypothetical protein
MDRIDQISQGPDQSKATIDRAEHAMHASPYVSYNWRRGQVDRHVWVRCAVDVVVVVVVVVFILRPLFSPPFLLSLSLDLAIVRVFFPPSQPASVHAHK